MAESSSFAKFVADVREDPKAVGRIFQLDNAMVIENWKKVFDLIRWLLNESALEEKWDLCANVTHATTLITFWHGRCSWDKKRLIVQEMAAILEVHKYTPVELEGSGYARILQSVLGFEIARPGVLKLFVPVVGAVLNLKIPPDDLLRSLDLVFRAAQTSVQLKKLIAGYADLMVMHAVKNDKWQLAAYFITCYEAGKENLILKIIPQMVKKAPERDIADQVYICLTLANISRFKKNIQFLLPHIEDFMSFLEILSNSTFVLQILANIAQYQPEALVKRYATFIPYAKDQLNVLSAAKILGKLGHASEVRETVENIVEALFTLLDEHSQLFITIILNSINEVAIGGALHKKIILRRRKKLIAFRDGPASSPQISKMVEDILKAIPHIDHAEILEKAQGYFTSNETLVKEYQTNPVPIVHEAFLSHAQADVQDAAGILTKELGDRGVKVWYDQDTKGSIDVKGMILGVANSTVFLIFASQQYFGRPFCVFELLVAQALKKDVRIVLERDLRHGGFAKFDDFIKSIPGNFRFVLSNEAIDFERRAFKKKATMDHIAGVLKGGKGNPEYKAEEEVKQNQAGEEVKQNQAEEEVKQNQAEEEVKQNQAEVRVEEAVEGTKIPFLRKISGTRIARMAETTTVSMAKKDVTSSDLAVEVQELKKRVARMESQIDSLVGIIQDIAKITVYFDQTIYRYNGKPNR